MNSQEPDFELRLFSTAKTWKKYWSYLISNSITGRVAEVGAGIGTNVEYLLTENIERLVLIEPNRLLFDSLNTHQYRDKVECINATLQEVDMEFDSILYIDVLEHIEDHVGETTTVYDKLKQNGSFIVVVPAHPYLYTEFDETVGHFRRYTRKSLDRVVDSRFARISSQYLDSVGMLASIGNKWALKSSSPSKHQIAIWDRCMVPLSRFIDPLLGYRVGKSIVAVYRKV